MTQPFLFVDRDGTIIADKNYLSNPDGVELLPNAPEGLARLADAGFRLVVVTNQSGIGRGYFTRADYEKVNQRMADLLARSQVQIHDALCCPHAPSDDCACRKPSPGLLLEFAKRNHVDFQTSVVIGDKACDIELGKTVGCLTILVLTGQGSPENLSCRPDFVAKDLLDAADWLARRTAP